MDNPKTAADLEDSVCRAAYSAALALNLVEDFTGAAQRLAPLTKDEQELLYFAVAEAVDYTANLKAQFYEVLRVYRSNTSHGSRTPPPG